MPVKIGQPAAHNFHQPMKMMSDCHRRIESFLGVLVKLAKHAGNLGDQERRALEGALRYFRESGPRHTADEEISLFPRLRALNDPAVQATLVEVEHLETDHREAENLHAEIDILAEQWLAGGVLPAYGALRFQEATARLAEIYAAHIQTEDSVVFPLAEKVLPPAEQTAIGNEMARRRQS